MLSVSVILSSPSHSLMFVFFSSLFRLCFDLIQSSQIKEPRRGPLIYDIMHYLIFLSLIYRFTIAEGQTCSNMWDPIFETNMNNPPTVCPGRIVQDYVMLITYALLFYFSSQHYEWIAVHISIRLRQSK